MPTSKIVVGIDGSDHSARALQWCAVHAEAFGAEVIVVHVIEIPLLLGAMLSIAPLPPLTRRQREEIRDLVVREWCKPLADAGVCYRVTLSEGSAPAALARVAEDEDADLVVTGRRGRGEFAELVLGSTSHALTHCLTRPLVIVP